MPITLNIMFILKPKREAINKTGKLMRFPEKISTESIPRNDKKYKLILLWNKYFGRPILEGYIYYKGNYVSNLCKPETCIFTENRLIVDDADAIIFHYYPSYFKKNHLPARKHDNQKYIAYVLEPPVNFLKHPNMKWVADDFFDIYITYHRDSDIRTPYFGWRKKYKSEINITNDKIFMEKVSKNFEEKKFAISQFVSNCHSYSGREKYVTELQKYIPVDVYGLCGPKKCTNRYDQRCYDMLNQYRFYLSFENSYCEDYVTEKLFKILEQNVIPIVMGSANYTEAAPPHSIINVADFKSPKHLAEHLNMLSSNKDEYVKYLTWKMRYSLVRKGGMLKTGMCKLCKLLHNETFMKTKSLRNMNQLWSVQTQCDLDYNKHNTFLKER